MKNKQQTTVLPCRTDNQAKTRLIDAASVNIGHIQTGQNSSIQTLDSCKSPVKLNICNCFRSLNHLGTAFAH
jgi:hypothetical protein